MVSTSEVQYITENLTNPMYRYIFQNNHGLVPYILTLTSYSRYHRHFCFLHNYSANDQLSPDGKLTMTVPISFFLLFHSSTFMNDCWHFIFNWPVLFHILQLTVSHPSQFSSRYPLLWLLIINNPHLANQILNEHTVPCLLPFLWSSHFNKIMFGVHQLEGIKSIELHTEPWHMLQL